MEQVALDMAQDVLDGELTREYFVRPRISPWHRAIAVVTVILDSGHFTSRRDALRVVPNLTKAAEWLLTANLTAQVNAGCHQLGLIAVLDGGYRIYLTPPQALKELLAGYDSPTPATQRFLTEAEASNGPAKW